MKTTTIILLIVLYLKEQFLVIVFAKNKSIYLKNLLNEYIIRM